MTFSIAKFDSESGTYGERCCPYDDPDNAICEDMEDAREKAIFAFEDDGTTCKRVGKSDFVTSYGDDYRVFLSE